MTNNKLGLLGDIDLLGGLNINPIPLEFDNAMTTTKMLYGMNARISSLISFINDVINAINLDKDEIADLQSKKLELDYYLNDIRNVRKIDDNGNFTGTWNGVTLHNSSEGLSSDWNSAKWTFDSVTSRLADMTSNIQALLDSKGSYPTLVERLNAIDVSISNINLEIENARGGYSNVDARLNAIDTEVSTINTDIGSLNNLTTTDKTSVVNSINENKASIQANSTAIANNQTAISNNTTAINTITKNTKLPHTKYKLLNKLALVGEAYGDSLTAGFLPNGNGAISTNPYPNELCNMLKDLYGYTNITILNNGLSGKRSDEGLANFDTYVTPNNPDFCIIMFGTNDILQAKDSETMRSSLEGMIAKCKTNNIEAILMTIPPIHDINFSAQVGTFNSVIREVARLNNVVLVDLNEELELAISNKLDSYKNMLPDNVHFAEGKYKYIADVVLAKSLYDNCIMCYKDVCVPAVNSRYVKTDCTVINSSSYEKYSENYILRGVGGVESGTYLKTVFYNNMPNSTLYNLGVRTVNGGKITPLLNDGSGANAMDFYDPNGYWDIEIPILSNASFGIKKVNFLASSGTAGTSGQTDMYFSGFGAKSVNGNWYNATLLNSWQNIGGYFPASFKKTSEGLVWLRGTITLGTKTANTVLFVLPPEFRPSAIAQRDILIEAVGNVNTGSIRIDPNGNVSLTADAGGNWIDLNGVSFSL